jgi:hypothetical protein
VLVLSVFAFAGVATAASTAGPDPAVHKWPSWPHQATCGVLPFDPVPVFSGPTGVELGSRPSEVALREVLQKRVFPWLPQHNWRLLAESQDQAEFTTGRLGARSDWLLFEQRGGIWRWVSSGACIPRSLRDGIKSAEWSLDPEKPRPRPRSRVLTLRVSEQNGCTGGANPNPRVQEPELRYTKTRLIVTLWVKPLPPDYYTCPGVFAPPYRIRLPRPLGRRALLDGGTYPPTPAKRGYGL